MICQSTRMSKTNKSNMKYEENKTNEQVCDFSKKFLVESF